MRFICSITCKTSVGTVSHCIRLFAFRGCECGLRGSLSVSVAVFISLSLCSRGPLCGATCTTQCTHTIRRTAACQSRLKVGRFTDNPLKTVFNVRTFLQKTEIRDKQARARTILPVALRSSDTVQCFQEHLYASNVKRCQHEAVFLFQVLLIMCLFQQLDGQNDSNK